MNSVVHFEIPFDDAERAHNFYKEAFGWQINAVPELNYAIASTTESDENGPKTPGAINGGMTQRSDNITGVTIILNTDDLDTSIEKVKACGGSIISGKTAVGDFGLIAYFKDTEGNHVGLWQDVKKN